MGIAPFNINMKKNPKDENRYWVEMEVPVLKNSERTRTQKCVRSL